MGKCTFINRLQDLGREGWEGFGCFPWQINPSYSFKSMHLQMSSHGISPPPLPVPSSLHSSRTERSLPCSSCPPACPCPARGWPALDASRRRGLGAAPAQMKRVRARVLHSALGALGRAATLRTAPSLSVGSVWRPDLRALPFSSFSSNYKALLRRWQRAVGWGSSQRAPQPGLCFPSISHAPAAFCTEMSGGGGEFRANKRRSWL